MRSCIKSLRCPFTISSSCPFSVHTGIWNHKPNQTLPLSLEHHQNKHFTLLWCVALLDVEVCWERTRTSRWNSLCCSVVLTQALSCWSAYCVVWIRIKAAFTNSFTPSEKMQTFFRTEKRVYARLSCKWVHMLFVPVGYSSQRPTVFTLFYN